MRPVSQYGVPRGNAPLRDRKKAATADALYRAAVRLAIARGLDDVTVEAIADEAEVSRRTFSNYFANKEDALLHGDRARMRRLLDELRGGHRPRRRGAPCGAARRRCSPRPTSPIRSGWCRPG